MSQTRSATDSNSAKPEPDVSSPGRRGGPEPRCLTRVVSRVPLAQVQGKRSSPCSLVTLALHLWFYA